MSERQRPSPHGDDSLAWSLVGTLVAGPLVWGAIGLAVDKLAGTHGVFLPIGAVVGFAASLYLVYVKYSRS